MEEFTARCLPKCLRIDKKGKMDRSTKLLIVACIFVIITGFSFLWFGLQPAPQTVSVSTITTASSVPSVATYSATQGVTGEQVVVSRVIDGDTVELESGKAVRFVGVDTPETVDPRRPVGCFGKEASDETKKLLTGKKVILQKDVSATDKYGRLLRFIFLPLENGEMLFVNDYLVREGFAKVKTYPPDRKFESRFLEAQEKAKIQKKGLWGKCI